MNRNLILTKIWPFVISSIFIFIDCENPITDYGPQPIVIDKQKFTPMMNVFGVLRPDSLQGFPRSFIHLEQTSAVTVEYPDTVEITDARVKLFSYANGQVIDTLEFHYKKSNDVLSKPEYRNELFSAIAGRVYGLSCHKQGFPELTSTTTIPYAPAIVEDSWNISADEISFIIVRDSLAALYDIFVIIGQDEYQERILRPETGNIWVKINLQQHSENQGQLVIYSYDLKLAEYMTYNVIIKPNTYHASYSTVENGYGCFGSLNLLEKSIEF